MARDDPTEAGRGQISLGLVGHVKKFGIHLKRDEMFLRSLSGQEHVTCMG